MTESRRAGATPWPVEIRIKRSERVVEIDFDDGARFSLPAELLRVESPSAEVRGHGAADKRIIGGKRSVAVIEAEPVGNYAVRLVFDDGHETGLYSWTLLRHLGEHRDEIWAAYLAALDARGLTRDP